MIVYVFQLASPKLIKSYRLQKQLHVCKLQKHQQFDSDKKTARSNVFNKTRTMNYTSLSEIKHKWVACTLIIVGNSIVTGIDEKVLIKFIWYKWHL